MFGYCSRREAERLIAQRRVSVNGQVIETPATFFEPEIDHLAVDGNEVARPARRSSYLAVHKPRGVVSTVRDPHAERTVIQLVPSQHRLYPVGRLDKDSEGLIILTNDGAFANRIAHPRYRTDREYFALLTERPSDTALHKLRRGIKLDEHLAVPVSVELASGSESRALSAASMRQSRVPSRVSGAPGGVPRAKDPGLETRDATWLRVVIREGRNREVRRVLEAVGYPVQRLVRTRIGPVHLGNLRPGTYRELTRGELKQLGVRAWGSSSR